MRGYRYRQLVNVLRTDKKLRTLMIAYRKHWTLNVTSCPPSKPTIPLRTWEKLLREDIVQGLVPSENDDGNHRTDWIDSIKMWSCRLTLSKSNTELRRFEERDDSSCQVWRIYEFTRCQGSRCILIKTRRQADAAVLTFKTVTWR